MGDRILSKDTTNTMNSMLDMEGFDLLPSTYTDSFSSMSSLVSILIVGFPALIMLLIIFFVCVIGPKKRKEAKRKLEDFAQRVGLDENYEKTSSSSEMTW